MNLTISLNNLINNNFSIFLIQFTCQAMTTITPCPPSDCPPQYQTIFVQGEDGGCPQYTCVLITTPLIPSTTPPSIIPCEEVSKKYG